LAVEQTYGYLYHNFIKRGILCTYNGFSFMRQNGRGELWMTPLIPCNSTNPTILQILYWWTALCVSDEEVPTLGPSGERIAIGFVGKNITDVPQAPGPFGSTSYSESSKQNESSDNKGNDEKRRKLCYENDIKSIAVNKNAIGLKSSIDNNDESNKNSKKEDLKIIFHIIMGKPQDNHVGGKVWKAKIVESNVKIALKMWDSYVEGCKERDQEAKVMGQLQSLWGKCVPSLIASGEWDFLWALAMEFIEVRYEHWFFNLLIH
jgi:hypothetical protein